MAKGITPIWGQVRGLANRIIPRDYFMRNVIKLTGATAISQAISIIFSPILTRLYKPENYGIVAIYSSILGIFSVIASLRYELAILLPEKDEDAASLLVLSLLTTTLTSTLFGLFIFIFGSKVVKLLNIQGLKPYLWLLPIGMLLVSSYQIFSRIALRMKSYGLIAKTKLIQGFSAPLSQIMLGLIQAGSLGLILGTIIGQSAGIVTFYSSFKKQITPRLQLHPLKNLAQRYKRFPQLSVIPSLINTIGLSIPIFALNKIYGPEVTGFFSLVQRAIGGPLSIISTSTSQVLLSQAANFKRINSNMEPLFWKSVRQQTIVSAPIFLLIPFMPYLFQTFFGSTWRTSGIYASVWLPALLGGFIFSPTGGFLDVLERQDLFIIRELIRLIIFIGATIIGSILKLKPLSMIIVFSIATVIFYFIYALFSLYAIKQEGKKCV